MAAEPRGRVRRSHRAILLAQASTLRAQADVLEQLAENSEEGVRLPDDGLVDRRTAGISGRLWDRLVASGELSVMRDGRRYVAYRRDVRAALERRHVPRGPEPRRSESKDEDEEERLLRRAGVRLGTEEKEK